MKLSKFFKSVEIEDDVYAIFNTLMMKILYVSKLELENIINLNYDNFKIMKEYGIYVDDDSSQDKKGLELMQNSQKYQSKKVAVLYFILSTSCNLKCKYCFV